MGLVDAAVDDGARAVAARHAGADLALRVSLDLAEDPERQDTQVRAALARSLTDLSTPWSVDRTVAGEVHLTVPRRDGSTEERAVTAVSIDDLAGRADLVAGSWAADDATSWSRRTPPTSSGCVRGTTSCSTTSRCTSRAPGACATTSTRGGWATRR